MNIKQRIEKLESKIGPVTQPGKAHTVFVMPGQVVEEQIEKFKAENNVGSNDDLWIIEFIKPDPRRFVRDVSERG